RISYAQDDDIVARGLERLAQEVRAVFDGAPAARAAVRRPSSPAGRITPLGAAARLEPRRQAASSVLLIRPAHFGTNTETTASNRFQRPPGAAADDARAPSSTAIAARRELDALADALAQAGVRAHVIEG